MAYVDLMRILRNNFKIVAIIIIFLLFLVIFTTKVVPLNFQILKYIQIIS